jgi:hypothetical protein
MTWESTLAAPLDALDGLVAIADPQPTITGWPYRLVLEAGTERAELANLTGKALSREFTGAATYSIVRGLAGSDAVDHDLGATVARSIPQSLLGLGGGEHPGLAAHRVIGLAAEHEHPYAADGHTHAAEPSAEHPDLAAHEQLGLAADHEHPFAADADLTAHAATAHGLSSHAIDGAYHSGLEVLPTQGQKNALAGTSGTPGTTNQYVTHQDSRLSDARTPTAHDHDAVYSATDHTHTLSDADIPAGVARDSEVTTAIATHAATPHGGTSGERYKVGDLYLTTTDFADAATVATAEGYGTWERFGVGRFLLLTDGTAGTEAGASTHSHGFTQPDDHTDVPTHTHTTDSQGAHVHDEYNNSATTGPNVGWGAQDTSTNTASLTGYDTGSAGAHTHTAAAPAGAVASQPHAGGSVADGTTDPLSITAYAWKRTA